MMARTKDETLHQQRRETILRAAYTYEQSQDYHKELAPLGGTN